MPQYIEDILENDPKADVCLVDHQQTSQLNPAIPVENIVGVIDHHALQSKTIVTDKPIRSAKYTCTRAASTARTTPSGNRMELEPPQPTH